MDSNHDDDDHPSATNSLPLMDDDDDGDDEDSYTGSGFGASPPPLCTIHEVEVVEVKGAIAPCFPNSDNLKPNWKLKEVVIVTANTTHEAYNIIPEEEAVCRFCFHRLFPVDINNNNVMKTKCGCPFTLTHENCVINNNKCDMCDQDVHYIPVTLSRASSISTKKEVDDKGSSSRSSTLMKWSCFKTIS